MSTTIDTTPTTQATGRPAPHWYTRLTGSGGAFVGLAALFVVLSLTTPGFFSSSNLLNVLDQATVLSVIAVGATAVIITGGIDLSVGSVLALSTMVLGWLSHDGGFPMWIAILAALATGALAGLANGLGVTLGKLPPFIATLAMFSIARGLANLITDGRQIIGYPDWFFQLSSNRYIGVLSVTVLVMIVTFAIGGIYLKRRPGGRSLYAIGGGKDVARLAGLKVKKITTMTYVWAGLLAGLGGVILATRLNSSQPSAGTGLELDVIAAVVIGGASLNGGTGRIAGTIAGVFIMGMLRNGLNLLGVSPFLQQIFIGLVIALAVMADVLQRRTK
ncbi:ABC transporter permease [Pseudactinotalea sp. HY160]|uniref:ABC transporter permease n=1 Tax=Pseudactinotalea sp. HY160 TaxID=2654490 RepID=UPI00128BFEEE|nr:ABC transporter permease [Pseudactinotalea sp. HY160]MPV51006.1 ABC transporter permease [Pseudactinotalea sp. HY160]